MSKKVKDTCERGHEDVKDTGDVAREGWVPPWESLGIKEVGGQVRL